MELLGRFELPDVRRFAADIRRMIESAFGGRSAVQIPIIHVQAKEKEYRFTVLFLELLGRFELPTSSLPMTRSTD